nr:unnamed protein product [Callosobruchus analis]
MRMSRKDF